MSPNDDNPEESKKNQKKFLWFGYGSYGLSNPINPNNMRAAPDILEKLFELFGVKEKEENKPDEYKE